MRRPSKKLAAIIAAGAIVAVGGGMALAYWSQGGTGSGTAATGTTSGITVNQTSVVTGLYPGGPTQALSGNFDNPNSGPVTISSVTATVSSVTGAGTGSGPACTAADYAIGGAAAGSIVPAGTAQGAWSGLTVQLTNNASANQDNCKGATAHITYTANP